MEVRVADDSDIERLRVLCDSTDGWKQEYCKNNTVVWTKRNDTCDFKMVKVRVEYTDVRGSTLYDVLHDADYRATWDHSMLKGYEICCLNPNNDIGYYAMKLPSPFKNRDFVTQRSWLDTGTEYYIINHSVDHAQFPPMKGYIRGISYLTGYLIRPRGDKTCQFTYVSQSDPRGKLPKWAVNKATQIMAPRVISRIHKACKSYESWKQTHKPNYKPWLFPEQISLPRVNMSEVKAISAGLSLDSLDESELNEADLVDDDQCDDEDI